VQSVLLVTLDTARADVLSGDAASRALAPRIAELAEGGVRFPRAYTTAPLTVPAHASILSGLVPPRHGVRDNGLAALPESAETLAEVLRARGFATAAFVSCLVLDRGFGLDQGFERYDQPALAHRTAENYYVERPARDTVRAAGEWLEELDPARPFFLWVHLYDAHLPYEPASEPLERAGGDAYRGEIAALDDAVGELLDALERAGLARTTLVALTADHGESLGEHGEPTHGALCYEAAVRVPLVFRFPLVQPLPSQAHIASLVDLYPTLLATLGLSAPADLDGVDLFAPVVPLERGVYLESYSGYLNHGWSPLAGWVDARGKYLHSSEPEYYSSVQDPEERRDLARSRREECAEARERIAEVLARPVLAREEREDDPDLAAALSVLGYARGSSADEGLPSPLDPSDRPSPKSRAGELEPLQRAFTLFEAGRMAECRPLVERIVRENPRHLLALDLLALCLMDAGEFAAAEDVLRQRLEAGPEAADTRLNLGLCRLELGDAEGALPEIEAAARLTPGEPAVQEALGRVHEALER
jgi:arylsulfatase A-like enzyme